MEDEMLSHRLLEDLKEDIEALKKKLSEPEAATHELVTEMEELKSSIKDLQNLFREALHDIKEEDSNKLLVSLQHQIETIVTQNETIARGMVAISDKLEDFMKGHSSAPRMAPPVHHMPPPPPLGMPPPPSRPKRESIFK